MKAVNILKIEEINEPVGKPKRGSWSSILLIPLVYHRA